MFGEDSGTIPPFFHPTRKCANTVRSIPRVICAITRSAPTPTSDPHVECGPSGAFQKPCDIIMHRCLLSLLFEQQQTIRIREGTVSHKGRTVAVHFRSPLCWPVGRRPPPPATAFRHQNYSAYLGICTYLFESCARDCDDITRRSKPRCQSSTIFLLLPVFRHRRPARHDSPADRHVLSGF